MDAKTCLQKLQLVGTLSFATVDEKSAPQIRCVSAIHFDENSFCFFTARGKNLCRELLTDGRVQILAHTRFNEMIRVSARAVPAPDCEQQKKIDIIFSEQPYLSNVYPENTRKIGIIFEIHDMEIEYFNLGVKPIFRESYTIGSSKISPKGYFITDKCIGCGKCVKSCPQKCTTSGKPFKIQYEHCLHCGACFEECPVKAVERIG